MQLLAPEARPHGCPGRQALIDFDLGRLPSDSLDAIGAHASSCPDCGRILGELQVESGSDPVVGLLKRALGGSSAEGRGSSSVLLSLETVELDARAMPPGAGSAPEGAAGGREFGNYELLGEIARGGMGVVYRARQVGLGRIVALKRIGSGRFVGHHAIDRFHLEGRAIARLVHPNVVQVHDFGECDGLPYYSMELVEGGSLQARIDAGPLMPDEAARLLLTLAKAVAYAHGRGVIHRDLKPANILIAADGTPKVADFGLAKLLDADADGGTPAHLTEADAILGTASYMAPEQASGRASEVNPRTDVYALGAILYACLTGTPPFLGESKLETLALVREGRPLPPTRRRPGIPPALEEICLRCLERDPGDRYPSAQALVGDLERFLDGGPRRAYTSRLARLGRRLRRHVAALAVGTSMLATMGVVAFLSIHSREGRADRIGEELSLGHPVTLIGAQGGPRWSRWRTGAPKSRVGLNDDLTFSLHSWTLGLLELVPDPRMVRYRVSAQVRHEDSDTRGEVGLYFSHTVSPGDAGEPEIHFFEQVSVNAARAREARHFPEIPGVAPPVVPEMVPVRMLTQIHVDADPPVGANSRIGHVTGPGVLPARGKDARWHDIEVTVTPGRVTARWDGTPFHVDTARLQQAIDRSLLRYPPRPTNTLSRGFASEFTPRGGLGLYIWNGSASFRNVTITPL